MSGVALEEFRAQQLSKPVSFAGYLVSTDSYMNLQVVRLVSSLSLEYKISIQVASDNAFVSCS